MNGVETPPDSTPGNVVAFLPAAGETPEGVLLKALEEARKGVYRNVTILASEEATGTLTITSSKIEPGVLWWILGATTRWFQNTYMTGR